MHPINFVFDIDDTLVLHFEKKEWKKQTEEIVDLYGTEFLEKHTVWAIDYPHFIFPGIPTLWRWLYGQGHRLAMFSSAVQERNEELADNLMPIVFGEEAPKVQGLFRHPPDRTYVRFSADLFRQLQESALRRGRSAGGDAVELSHRR